MATAEQTVGKVLDATNKRYLVEHAEAEDGSWWYDLYSDGFIRQGGLVDMPSASYSMTATVQFPKNITKMLNPSIINYSQYEGSGVVVKSYTESAMTFILGDAHDFIVQAQCFWMVEAIA